MSGSFGITVVSDIHGTAPLWSRLFQRVVQRSGCVDLAFFVRHRNGQDTDLVVVRQRQFSSTWQRVRKQISVLVDQILTRGVVMMRCKPGHRRLPDKSWRDAGHLAEFLSARAAAG